MVRYSISAGNFPDERERNAYGHGTMYVFRYFISYFPTHHMTGLRNAEQAGASVRWKRTPCVGCRLVQPCCRSVAPRSMMVPSESSETASASGSSNVAIVGALAGHSRVVCQIESLAFNIVRGVLRLCLPWRWKLWPHPCDAPALRRTYVVGYFRSTYAHLISQPFSAQQQALHFGQAPPLHKREGNKLMGYSRIPSRVNSWEERKEPTAARYSYHRTALHVRSKKTLHCQRLSRTPVMESRHAWLG